MTTNENTNARIHRISVSAKMGEKKRNVRSAFLFAGAGIDGDAHGTSNRPLSLLPFESFVKVSHPRLDIEPGDFAENITTLGLDFASIVVGSKLRLGDAVEIEIVQIGKECHNGCIIRETVGDCIMPREGVFAKVLTGGRIQQGDRVELLR